MPAKETMALDDDVELRTVALASPLNRTMVKDAIYTEETIETSRGKVLVAWAGDRRKPAILTYHDLGLNYISNFQVWMELVNQPRPRMMYICVSISFYLFN